MNFLLPLEIFLTVCALGVLGAVVLVACCDHFYRDVPLLDGRPLLSPLDEHAHERLSLEARLAEDAEVGLLDSWFALDARDHA